MYLLRSFNVVCPFCKEFHAFPNTIDEVYQCACGSVYQIAWRSDMEDALDYLAQCFANDGESMGENAGNDVLCYAFVYEDIQNLIKMKMEYEEVTFMRPIQSFDRNYPQKIGLIRLGNYGENRSQGLKSPVKIISTAF